MSAQEQRQKRILRPVGREPVRWATGLLLLVALVACLSAPVLAFLYARQPFPGFFLLPSMVIAKTDTPSWAGEQAGLTYPRRIVEADGRPLERPADLNHYLRTLPLGAEVTYTVEDESGRRWVFSQAVPTAPFPMMDMFMYFWTPYFTAAAYLVCALWLYRARHQSLGAQAGVLLCTSVALFAGLMFDAFTTHMFDRLWTASMALCAAALAHVGMAFPEPVPCLRRRSWFAGVPYLIAFGLIGWEQSVHSSATAPWSPRLAWYGLYTLLAVGTLVFLGSLLYTRYSTKNFRIRQQSRTILLGGALSFLPLVGWFVARMLGPPPFIWRILPAILLFMAVFPFVLAYAITREEALDVDRVIGRGLVYSLLAVLLIGIYLLLAALIGWLAPGLLRADDPITLAFLVIVAAMLASPWRRRLETLVERLLYRERFDFRHIVQEFGQSLAQVIDLPELSRLILEKISGTLHLDAASLYLFDQRTGTYHRCEHSGRGEDPPPVFSDADLFIQRLRTSNQPIYRHHQRAGWLRDLPPEEKERVNRLYGIVFLPLRTQNHLSGWLNLGARLSGDTYSSDDLELLNALADRAAVAIENARLFAERERRLTELAVLNEIGQAINSVLSLPQVLETIYRETGRLMDTTNFYIALYDPEREEVTFPLFVEEGKAIAAPSRRRGNGLTEYILRTGQPMLIAERVEEQVRHLGLDLIIIGKPATSWLGVPIFHEGRPIGVIVVQSTRPGVTYDVDDMAILSKIATQAAIAIENARLYEMTDQALTRRLEEATALAEFVRTLSTLALEPDAIVEETLSQAAEVLQAECGIIVRPDEAMERFQALAQLRWSPLEEWEEVWQRALPDLLTAPEGTLLLKPADLPAASLPAGAAPQHLLCPLVREDTLLALLHLGLPEEPPPEETRRRFLRHLADHAAIALENALLYQQQVEQRQVLDRRAACLAEILNLSNALRRNLDLEEVFPRIVQAAQKTLGFRLVMLSVQEQDGLDMRLVAAAGYPQSLLAHLQAMRHPLPLYQRVMRPEFRVGNSYLLCPRPAEELDEFWGTFVAPLPEDARPPTGWNERLLLITPLRGSDEQILGFLTVYDHRETNAPDKNLVDILEIFANQAAIAIEGAHLYRTLRESNEAKSEFLSVIAHELRTPMRAIWGYASLLEEGRGGNVEEQRAFLQIIRANIARLDNLVNDLLAVSRLESGRLIFKPLDLSEVLRESVLVARPALERKGLELRLDLPGELLVQGDPERLVQVFTNLLSNAIKYTPAPGTVSLSARLLRHAEELDGAGPPQATVTCPCVLVRVSDTGIGMTPQEQTRIFRCFFRSEHPLVRQEEGTGLGLYVVHLIVQAHRGQVWVESAPEQGSTFSVALPLAPTAAVRPQVDSG